MEELNPFKIAQEQLDKAVKLLGLDSATHAILREPMMEFHFAIPVRMDSDEVKIFKGFRVQYNNAKGPCKGGLRFHPEETIDTVRALAAWMTWKTAVVNIPLGGGKGGVICNPEYLSEREIERLSRGYIRQVGKFLGVTKDVPAPDVNTNPQIMAWMMDEYETISGEKHPCVITGKPIPLGGSEGRRDATARGGIYTVRESCKHLGINPANATYAIQGFGKVGGSAATLHQEILGGGQLVAISDINGGIYNRNGFDPYELIEWMVETKRFRGFPSAEKEITNEELLELPVDILYPAAVENVITEKNAGNIRAKLICEMANGPTTPLADKILYKNGIFVIPDVLANAGGVIVSYFEQVQNTYNFYWELKDVQHMLDQKITKAFKDVYAMHKKKEIDMRTAAYLVAVKRVADVMKLRGWV
ncbi:Glu/Leu/Phe/Val dehydrogenase [candidate division WOR-3 bacterium]|nr:Glu/Leu/Phe/Val dehydrogenase [candidate division WOR-3 bacterium]